MPYPSQVNHDQIVQTAQRLMERDGVEKLSLSKLAGELGIRAPSLYRYFENKEALLQAVNLFTLQQLFEAFDAALQMAAGEPAARLLAIAQTLRSFALDHPRLYLPAMTAEVGVTRPDKDLQVQMVLPIQAIMAEVCGKDQSLTALRGFLALAHGFIMLELHGQLQRGGDLNAAFADSIVAYLTGWQVAPFPTVSSSNSYSA